MNKSEIQEIIKVKKELGMLKPDAPVSIINTIKKLDSGILKRIVNKLNRERQKKKSRTRFSLTLPKPLSAKEAREVVQNIEFKKFKRPDVSIVIPIYNKFELTAGCLESLYSNLPKSIKSEIVLVDNASTDDSHKYLSKVTGIRYIKNKENLGFVDGCNIGVKASKGKYIVFLNNDTYVTKEWLPSLYDTVTKRSDAGIVGSKLIFPNGSLQEAGGVIFNDGSGLNYGKHDDPFNYKYNYVREVDYCSAASIIIKKSLFNKLGGFDKRYAPAYYEDTDLSFRVRGSGFKVLYQPESMLFHVEGATAGTSTSSGFKKYQTINHKKFVKKWKTELENQYSPEDTYKARDRSTQKLALIVDEHIPRPDEDSGSVRMYRIIESIQKLGYKVTFFPNFTGYTGKHVRSLQQLGVEVVYGGISFADFIRKHGSNYEKVILSRPRIASYYIDMCRIYCDDAQIIYDTVDLHYLRLRRQSEYEKGSKKKETLLLSKNYEVIEKYLMNLADKTLVVSSAEKSLLEKDGLGSIDILSNVHDSVESSYKVDYEQRKDLLFVGGYAHHPNIDAVTWFVDEIFPIVRKSLPEVKFRVVGSRMPSSLKRRLKGKTGVVVEGFVEDLDPILKASRVFVAPLRYGAGVKGKIGQAIEHGIPLVSTDIGTEGMFLEDGKSCLEANEASEFAEKVIRLYENKDTWDSVRLSAKKVLDANFSTSKTRVDLGNIFNA